MFEAVVSSDEVARGKPAPDVYVETARRLALRPSACVAVEDSVNGIRAAVEAGMAAVLVPNPALPPHADAFGLATAVVGRLADLDADAVLDAFQAANGRTEGGGTMGSDAARRDP
jgi:beta-phosphoglucomutase-like phosphatase (HAD superfamily)